MVKKNLVYLLFSAALMLVLPWCAVTFIKGDGGMAACFLLFFAINPIAAVVIGILSGKHIRSRWFLPLALAVLFVLGTWLHFDIGEPAFLLYGAVYAALGYAAALISALVSRRPSHS